MLSNYIVARAAERASLMGVHPRTLRHSCGFSLANRGHDLRLI
jgi:site-specific recombinase XerD